MEKNNTINDWARVYLCALVGIIMVRWAYGYFYPALIKAAPPTPPPIYITATPMDGIPYVENLTPIAGGAYELVPPTPIVWKIESKGDVNKLHELMNEKFAATPIDVRTTVHAQTGGVYPYCHWAYYTRPGDDPSRALSERLDARTVTLIRKGGYCSLGVTMVELYAGFTQKDLYDPRFVIIEEIAVQPYRDETTFTEFRPKKVLVTVQVRAGFLTASVLEGNQIHPAFVTPSDLNRAGINFDRKVWEIAEQFGFKLFAGEGLPQTAITESDRLAVEGAKLDAVAPFDYANPYGPRSNQHLDLLYEALVQSVTVSSGDPSRPSAYDNIQREMCTLAQAAGYEALVPKIGADSQPLVQNGYRIMEPACDVTVQVIWPYEQGTWYEVETFDSAGPEQVIKTEDLVPLRDNLYFVLTQEVRPRMDFNWLLQNIPDWAKSAPWFRVP